MSGALGVTASLIAIGGLGFAVFQTLTDGDHGASAATEAKQIVSFRQLADRICTENRQDLGRALTEGRTPVQLLAFLSRGTGWGINDLEGVTAPPSLASGFEEEVAVRREIREALLEIQRGNETGDRVTRAKAIDSLSSAERVEVTLAREMGLSRCASVLPRRADEAIGAV